MFTILPVVFMTVLAVYLIIITLFGFIGRDIDLKAARLKTAKSGSAEVGAAKNSGFSLTGLLNELKKKKKAKLRGRQINSTRSPEKQTQADIDLQMAGIPLSASGFMLIRFACGGALGLVVYLLGPMLKQQGSMRLLLGCAGFIGGMLLPRRWVQSKIKKKQDLYRDALPDIMDLLVVSVEAGLGFDSAILRLYDKDKSPLMQELMRAIQDVQHGMSKKEAYRNMSARCNVKELTSFLNSLIQAEQLGISVKSVLKSQAESLREDRRQRAQEKALKAPVKMLVPMVLFIFPVIFIVLLGPAFMNVKDMFL